METNYFDLKECSKVHPLHTTKSYTLFKRAQPRQNWQGSEVSVSQNLTALKLKRWRGLKYPIVAYFFLHDSVVQNRRFSFCREVWIRNVCRMWKSDPWPVHTESLPRPGVACSLPEVCRVQPVPGRVLHLLRPRRQNLLQKRLCKVGFRKYCLPLKKHMLYRLHY